MRLSITDFNQDTRNIRAEQDLEGAGFDPSVPDGEGLFLHDGEGTFLDRVGEAAGFLTANRRRGGGDPVSPLWPPLAFSSPASLPASALLEAVSGKYVSRPQAFSWGCVDVDGQRTSARA